MAEIQAVTASERDGTELLYFRATPVMGASPGLFRAVYCVTRENGHWVYRLQPGSLTMLDQGSQSSL